MDRAASNRGLRKLKFVFIRVISMTLNERPRIIESVSDAAAEQERRRPRRPKQVSAQLIALLRNPASIRIPGPLLGDANAAFLGDGLALAEGSGVRSARSVPVLAIIGWMVWAVLTAPILTVTVWIIWAMLH